MARETFLELVTWARRLRDAELPFMFVGAYAVAVHSLPRSTNDIDVVVHIPFEERERVGVLLHQNGVAEVHERVDAQWGKRLAGRLPSGLTIEIFFTPRNPVHDREYARHVLVPVESEEIPFLSAEDLVLRKLVNTRLRRGSVYDDVVGIIATQGDLLDLAYVREHAGFYRVGDLLERALKDAAAAQSEGPL